MRGTYQSGSLVLFCVLLLAAGAAQGGVIYPIGQASTAGFAQGIVTGPTARGWDFQANANVSVTQLGVNAAVSMPITLTLWDNGTQTELAQISVASAASTWVFGDLLTPVALTSGHVYSVIGWTDTIGAAPWYLFSNTPPAAFNPVGTIQYLNGRYSNTDGKDTFPIQTLPSPDQYGVTDIGYVTSLVPEPMSLTLVGAGMILLGMIRRRTKA